MRAPSVCVGVVHTAVYVPSTVSTEFALNTLYRSTFPSSRARFTLNIFVNRRSSCVNRFSTNRVPGAYSGTVTDWLHVTAVPHDERLRPSDGAMSALTTAKLAS